MSQKLLCGVRVEICYDTDHREPFNTAKELGAHARKVAQSYEYMVLGEPCYLLPDEWIYLMRHNLVSIIPDEDLYD